MKKFIRIAAAIIVLLVVGVVILYFSAGGLLRSGLEREASRALDTEVKVAGASVSLFGGEAKLSGLTVANPPGFQGPHALTLEDLGVQASVFSLLSHDVEVSEVWLTHLRLSVEEAGLKTNMGILLKKLKDRRDPAESARKYRIGLLRITGAKATLSSSILGGEAREVAVPDLELRNIGTSEGGATLAEVTAQILNAVLREVLKESSLPDAVRRVLSGELDLKGAVEGVIQEGKEAVEKGVEDARKTVEGAAQKVLEGKKESEE